MAAARDIVKGSLRALGRVGRGKSMTAEQGADGLEILNQMIGMWANETLSIPAYTTESFTYSSSKNEYTIGSGGDLDTVRPIKIVDAFHRKSNLDYPMRSMSLSQYNDIGDKPVGTIPTRYYYQDENPLGRLYFDYTPGTDYTLYLVSLKAIASFSDLNTTVSLPEGYEMALRTNLAIALAADYGVEPSQTLMMQAMSSKKVLKANNFSNRESILKVDTALRGNSFNIYSGD